MCSAGIMMWAVLVLPAHFAPAHPLRHIEKRWRRPTIENFSFLNLCAYFLLRTPFSVFWLGKWRHPVTTTTQITLI